MTYLGNSIDDPIFIINNYIDGFQLSNNGTDATNDIDVTAGQCTDSSNTDIIELASTLTKAIDVDWVAGNGGGFPSALTLTNDIWYHFFVIKNVSSGVVDAGFDTSTTATNLLADATGYTLYRRVGSIRRDTATNKKFTQHGDWFNYDVPIEDVALAAAPTTGTLRALTVPPDFKFIVSSSISWNAGGTQREYLFNDPDATDSVPSNSAFSLAVEGGTCGVLLEQTTNTSKQIRERGEVTNNRSIITRGYRDFRGKT